MPVLSPFSRLLLLSRDIELSLVVLLPAQACLDRAAARDASPTTTSENALTAPNHGSRLEFFLACPSELLSSTFASRDSSPDFLHPKSDGIGTLANLRVHK